MLDCGGGEDGGYLSVADVTVLDFLWVRALYWGGEHQGLAETSYISAYTGGDGAHCLLPITIGEFEGSLFSHSSDGFQLLYVINFGGGGE